MAKLTLVAGSYQITRTHCVDLELTVQCSNDHYQHTFSKTFSKWAAVEQIVAILSAYRYTGKVLVEVYKVDGIIKVVAGWRALKICHCWLLSEETNK